MRVSRPFTISLLAIVITISATTAAAAGVAVQVNAPTVAQHRSPVEAGAGLARPPGAGSGTPGSQLDVPPQAASWAPGWHVLTTDVIPGLAVMRRLGPVPANQQLQVGVALQDPNQAAEEGAAQAVYDRASPSFHHFFTPAQWQARFSLPATTLAAAVGQLTSKGLRVAYTAPTRTYLTLGGSAAQVERTFNVDLGQYRLPGGRTFFANVQAPRVPGQVAALIGLENLSVQLPTRPAPISPVQPETCTPDSCIPPDVNCVQHTTVCTGPLGPSDLWSIYGQPTTNRGQGQRVAVIGEGDMAQPVADLRAFESRFSLPQVAVRKIAVADDQTDTLGQFEWDIDTQAATGTASKDMLRALLRQT